MSDNKEEFLKITEELGIKNDYELYHGEMLSSEKFYDVNPGVIKVKTFIIFFKNKLSYLYSDWNVRVRTHENATLEERKDSILFLKDMIRYDDDSNFDPAIVEVGWSVTYNVHPREYDKDSRRKALMKFMIDTRKNLANGMFGYEPKPGIVLSARPLGPRLDLGFTDESLAIGKRTRSSFAQRFGFGPLQKDGFVYAIYDDECKVKPLDLE